MKKSNFDVPQAPPTPEANAAAVTAHLGAGNLMGDPKDTLFGSFGSLKPKGLDKLSVNQDNVIRAKYEKHRESGHKHIDKAVNHLYGDKFDHPVNDSEGLRKFIAEDGLNQQLKNTQEQPQLPNDPIASVYSQESQLLQTTKGNVSAYLNSIKPQPPQKLLFDNTPKNKQAERVYDKALHLAANPLSIFKDISKGNLTPSTVKSFSSMYPGLYDHLSKKITERLMSESLKGDKKPAYKVRQSLSLFLGHPLDSSLTPRSIQAAQMVFAAKKNPGPPPANSKAKLSKASQSTMTGDQARLDRQQSGKS